jgi:hypothetical protein
MTMEGGNAVKGTGLAGAIARARKRAYPEGYVASKDPLVNLESKEIVDYFSANTIQNFIGIQELSYSQDLSTDLSYSGRIMMGDVIYNPNGVTSLMDIDGNGKFTQCVYTTVYDEELEDDKVYFACRGMAIEAGIGTKKILIDGLVRNDAWNWTPGSSLYMIYNHDQEYYIICPMLGKGWYVVNVYISGLQYIGYAISPTVIMFQGFHDKPVFLRY